MTTKNILEQLQGLLQRLEDGAPYNYYDDFYDASDDDFIEEDGLGCTEYWDDEPKRSIPFLAGGFLGLIHADAAASPEIFADKGEDEEEKWEEESAELNRKSRAELLQIIQHVKAAAERNETITPEFINRLLLRKFVSPCREMPKLTINNRNMLYVQADEVEIKMSAQMRALYILFLLNPNGIRITNFHDYRRQFTAIYRIVTTRANYERCVSKLFDRNDSNHRNFYSLLSKINSTIDTTFSDIEVGHTFQISNVGNGLYRIKLRPGQFILPRQDKWLRVMNL